MDFPSFEAWSSPLAISDPIEELHNTRLGIDASYFLKLCVENRSTTWQMLASSNIPYLSLVEEWSSFFDFLRQSSISPIVVFNGMQSLHSSQSDRPATLTAMDEQSSTAPERGSRLELATHRRLDSVRQLLSPIFRRWCEDQSVPYMTAPYAAIPQLVRLADPKRPYIDAVFAPASAIIYGTETVIISIQPLRSTFTWISRQDCLDEFPGIPMDNLITACLVSGCKDLPPFPLFTPEMTGQHIMDFRAVIAQLQPFQYDISTACLNFREDPRITAENYFERFQKLCIAVHFTPTASLGGSIDFSARVQAPKDVHDVIGSRLPDELFFYLQKGLISSDILNALASHEFLSPILPDDRNFLPYRALLDRALKEIQIQSFTILCQPLHRYFRYHDVTIQGLQSEEAETFKAIDNFATLKICTDSWNVRQALAEQYAGNLSAPSGSLLYCVQALAKTEFLDHSKTPRAPERPLLRRQDEIVNNVLWRFLHLRGYLDDEHNPTAWGRALTEMMSPLKPGDHLDEATLLSLELIRSKLLSEKGPPADLSQATSKESGESRVAAANLIHAACVHPGQPGCEDQAITQDRGVAVFYSVAMTIRTSLRQQLEAILTTLLLNGDAEEKLYRNDWAEISSNLPFSRFQTYHVGAVMNRFCAYASSDKAAASKPPSDSIKSEFSTMDMRNVEAAIRLWDVLLIGIKTLDKSFNGAPSWQRTDAWLQKHRSLIR